MVIQGQLTLSIICKSEWEVCEISYVMDQMIVNCIPPRSGFLLWQTALPTINPDLRAQVTWDELGHLGRV